MVDDAEAEIAAPVRLLGEGAVERHLDVGLVGLADDPERALGDPGDRDRDLGLGRRGGKKRPRDDGLSNEPHPPHRTPVPRFPRAPRLR